ncbi:MAG: gluconate 2-dehydrogenase subunit 3 family protein [Gemmatimonadales bacterium]
MSDSTTSRRDFLVSSGHALESTWIALNMPLIQATALYARRAAQEELPFETLTDREATELAAIAAQIIPTDDTPGAHEAGVIYFIDRALGSFSSSSLKEIRIGLQGLTLMVEAKFPGVTAFSELQTDEQIALLMEIEKTSFFSAVRNLTVTGMFAHPDEGGNRDELGWKILGFDSSPTFQPPFGYYDGEYTQAEGRE